MITKTLTIDTDTLEGLTYYLDWFAQFLDSNANEASCPQSIDFYRDHASNVRALEETAYRLLNAEPKE